jgi:hypothetical protein
MLPDTWSVKTLLGTGRNAGGASSLGAAARALLAFEWDDTLQLLAFEHKGGFAVSRAAFEFARFLLLAVHEGGSAGLSPSSSVDTVWHALMLSPVAYAKLCTAMCGSIIDHFPLRAYGLPSERAARLAHTTSLYTVVFGEAPPADIWDDEKRGLRGGVSATGASRNAAFSPRARDIDEDATDKDGPAGGIATGGCRASYIQYLYGVSTVNASRVFFAHFNLHCRLKPCVRVAIQASASGSHRFKTIPCH